MPQSNKKNKYGQYFTKKVIADFMVSLITKGRDCKILEPSCGEGVFLYSLEEHGFSNLSALEIDSTLANQFSYVRHESFISSSITEKYDVVIGNPPYIRWKNLEEELKAELQVSQLWNQYFNSLCDYLFVFILKSIEQLNAGGELIFICTEYWMNTTNSITLRNYMCEHGHISNLYHFKEATLFDGVTASFIIFKFIKTRSDNDIDFYYYTGKKLPTKEELFNLSCFEFKHIPQFKKNERWLLATEQTQDSLKRFEQACQYQKGLFDQALHRIGDFCDIGNGMVSGLDKAFVIENTNDLNEKEKSFLINVLKAKDLAPYTYKTKSVYVFIPEEQSKEDFTKGLPHLMKHFEPFISQLKERYSYNRNIPYWSFVFPRNKSLFERKGEKIFVPCKERISNKSFFRFCLAPEGFYPLQDVTCIVRKKECKESIEYLLAYLNNFNIFNWLQFNGIVKGAIVEFSEAPIASIPFRPINWKDEKEVKLHDEITFQTRNYLRTKDKTYLQIIEKHFDKLFYAEN